MTSLDGAIRRAIKQKNDARPPLAVMTYILDEAFLSCQRENCPATVLCQHATHGSHF